MADEAPAISFCTTCMCRRGHLERSMPANLKAMEGFGAEYILVDYGFDPGLAEWVAMTFGERVTVLSTARFPYFHMSHAKNIGHRAASGAILCNLDADAILRRAYIDRVLAAHSRGEVLTHGRRTSWGRITVGRDVFHRLGGYDETMRGWGFEDQDFLRRAARLEGVHVRRLDRRLFKSISHSDAERGARYEQTEIQATSDTNRARSAEKLRRGELVANEGRRWGDPRNQPR